MQLGSRAAALTTDRYGAWFARKYLSRAYIKSTAVGIARADLQIVNEGHERALEDAGSALIR